MKFIISTPFPISPDEPLEIEIPTDLDDSAPRLTAIGQLGLTVWTETEWNEASERMKGIFPFPTPKNLTAVREAYYQRPIPTVEEANAQIENNLIAGETKTETSASHLQERKQNA